MPATWVARRTGYCETLTSTSEVGFYVVTFTDSEQGDDLNAHWNFNDRHDMKYDHGGMGSDMFDAYTDFCGQCRRYRGRAHDGWPYASWVSGTPSYMKRCPDCEGTNWSFYR